MDGAFEEEAIMFETQEGLESEGRGGPCDAEDSGGGVSGEEGLAFAGC